MVIRDGQQRRIAGREVVRGDIVIVSEGDRVAGRRRFTVSCESLNRRVTFNG